MELINLLDIFKYEDILVICDKEGIVEEEHENGENYFQLELEKDAYKLVFIEKENRDKYDVKEVFKTEKDALEFFWIFELKKKFTDKYIDNVMYDIDLIGTEDFTENDLLKLFEELSVEKNMYSFWNIKKNAVNLLKAGNNMCVVSYINKNGENVHITMELEKHIAIYALFRWTYLMFLFNEHIAKINKFGIVLDEVKDSDFKILLS